MRAWRVGRNRSSQRRIVAPKLAKFRCRRDRGFYLGIPPAGTPKYWFLHKGIWAKKNPITRPIDCHLDYECRRYFEKIANTLAFWRQKRQKPLNSYVFSFFWLRFYVIPAGNEWGSWDPSWKWMGSQGSQLEMNGIEEPGPAARGISAPLCCSRLLSAAALCCSLLLSAALCCSLLLSAALSCKQNPFIALLF